MAYRFDPSTGSVVEDTSAPAQGSGIPQSVIDSDNIPMIDDQGKPVYVGKAKLAEAINAGFKYEPPEEEKARKEAEQYGTLPETLKTTAEAAASAASFGTSRELANQIGLSTPEAQAARLRVNPTAGDVGTLLGIGGALLAPEAGLAGIASAPVKAVGRLSAGITEAALPSIAKVAGESLAGKIASRAAASGLGSAVEGAAYGAGQAIDEHALGKSHDLAESVLMDVGLGTVLGGGIGAALGGLGGAYSHFAAPKAIAPEVALAEAGIVPPKVPLGSVEEAQLYGTSNKQGPTLRDAIGAEDLTPEAKATLFDGLNKPKANVAEITDAARELNLPVMEEMLTDSSIIHKAGEVARNSNTLMGAGRAEAYNSAWNGAAKAVEDTLGPATTQSRAELGTVLQDSIGKTFSAKAGPIKELYAEIEPYRKVLKVPAKTSNDLSRSFMDIAGENTVRGTDEFNFIRTYADSAADVTDLDKLKMFRSALGREKRPEFRHVASLMRKELDDLELNIIKDFSNQIPDPMARATVMTLADKIKQADGAYRAFMGQAEKIGSNVLGKKKLYGPQDFLNAIDEITPEKFAKKLFQKENSRFLGWMKNNFPEEVGMLAKFEKGQLAEKFTTEGQPFNAKGLLKQVNKLEKEYRDTLFNAAELKQLANAEVYLGAFPKSYNPSGTAQQLEFYKSLGNPIKMAMAEAQALAALKLVKGEGPIKKGIEYLASIERAAIKIKKGIETGAADIFRDSKDNVKKAVVPTVIQFDKKKEEKKKTDLHSSLLELSNDPLKLMARLEEKTRDMQAVAPQATAAMQEAMVRGITFLGSKVPIQPDAAPLSAKHVANTAQLAKFGRYYEAVQKPLSILAQIKNATITPEAVEAVSTVFPKMYTQMVTAVMDKVMDHQAKNLLIPYKTKLALSMFLGQDLVDSLNNQSMQMTQTAMMTQVSGEDVQNAVKPTSGALQKLTNSDRLLTPMQSSANRRNA